MRNQFCFAYKLRLAIEIIESNLRPVYTDCDVVFQHCNMYNRFFAAFRTFVSLTNYYTTNILQPQNNFVIS